MDVLKEALERIKPTKEEEKEVDETVKEFFSKLKGIKYVKPVLGGSGAKGTWLRGQHDIDVFLEFDYAKYKGESFVISDELEKELKKRFKRVDRLHGSRDYFQIKEGRFMFEIVPILAVKKADDADNITDISPLHAEWVNKHIKLADEMRLAKAFAKANGLYGAESHIRGFSGYVLEILTVKYGSFKKLLSESRKWKEGVVIDIAKHHKNVQMEVNKSKLQSPIVVIDPVQAGRNAAAALDKEQFERFKEKADSFLKEPAIDFFEKKKIDIDSLKKEAIVLRVSGIKGKPDIVGGKLRKVYDFIGVQLKEFEVEDKGWEIDAGVMWYKVKNDKLSEMKVWEGPPLDREKHVVLFKKKYKKTYNKNGRIMAEVKRKYTDPVRLVEEVIKDPYVTLKVSLVEVVK